MALAKPRRGPLILFIACILAACADPAKTTLTGQLRDAYTNAPIEGAQVTFGQRPGLATDAEGRYRTQNWDSKDVAVLQATGYQSATINLADRPELAKTRVLTVTLDTTLRPNTLSGIVRDGYSGEPIAGAVVRAGDTVTATTDEAGRYDLEGLPEAYQVRVSAPDYEATATAVRRVVEQHFELRPTTIVGLVTDINNSQPLEGVEVVLGDSRATTDAEGRFTLEDIPPDGQLVFTREGYDEVRLPLQRIKTVDVVMRPDVVEGVVLDAVSGAVLSDTLIMASETISGTVITSTQTNAEGRFRFEDMPEGTFITALRPGYERGQAQATPGTPVELRLQPITATALYIKANNAVNREDVLAYFDGVDKTELNAVVLDPKSDDRADAGPIFYKSGVPLIQELGTSADRIGAKRRQRVGTLGFRA